MKEEIITQASPGKAYQERKTEIDAAIQRVLESGQYILGPELHSFEQEFAQCMHAAHAIGLANGTDALELALRALDIGAGDSVFTVSHTAVATVAAIERTGAQAILVDVDAKTYTMCPTSLKQTLEEYPLAKGKKGAIIPVHLYGHPAPMDEIMALAQHYELPVIEDCAQAHSATLKGKTVGTIGCFGAFSLYPTKNLGALGDAGALITQDATLANKIHALRQYGWKERYNSSIRGCNSRLDSLQAAILRVKLPYLAEDTARRQQIAQKYTEGLRDFAELQLPQTVDTATHVFHQYVIQSPKRDALAKFLAEKGIGTAIHYPQPIHLQAAYKDSIRIPKNGLPLSEKLATRILSLPIYPQLRPAQVGNIITTIQYFQIKQN